MKKLIVLTGMTVFLMAFGGCGNRELNSENGTGEVEYTDFEELFRESYTKYIFENYYIDADAMADYFIANLEQFEDEWEIFEDQGNVRKSFKNKGTTYAWEQFSNGGVFLSIYDGLSNQNDEELRAKARTFLESLDVEVTYEQPKVYQQSCTDIYRQIIDGVPVSSIQGNGAERIVVDMEGSFSMQFPMPIGDITAVEVYDASEFLELDFVKELLERYRKESAADIETPVEHVELMIHDVEIVYYVSIENEQYVLEPMYEIEVTEDADGARYEATYIVDVLTGYIEYREGDPYWL